MIEYMCKNFKHKHLEIHQNWISKLLIVMAMITNQKELTDYLSALVVYSSLI